MKTKLFAFALSTLCMASCAAQTVTSPTVPMPPLPRTHPDTLNHCEFKYTPARTIEWYTSQMTEGQLPEYFNIHIFVFTDVNGNKVVINSLELANYTCTVTQVP